MSLCEDCWRWKTFGKGCWFWWENKAECHRWIAGPVSEERTKKTAAQEELESFLSR